MNIESKSLQADIAQDKKQAIQNNINILDALLDSPKENSTKDTPVMQDFCSFSQGLEPISQNKCNFFKENNRKIFEEEVKQSQDYIPKLIEKQQEKDEKSNLIKKVENIKQNKQDIMIDDYKVEKIQDETSENLKDQIQLTRIENYQIKKKDNIINKIQDQNLLNQNKVVLISQSNASQIKKGNENLNCNANLVHQAAIKQFIDIFKVSEYEAQHELALYNWKLDDAVGQYVLQDEQKTKLKPFYDFSQSQDIKEYNKLIPCQKKAYDYISQIAKISSDEAYPKLLEKFHQINKTEEDLLIVLNFILEQAPIIIHFNLAKCLPFFAKDTHYRNLFETNTGGGCLDKNVRGNWENKLFNNIYKNAKPFERVKYGVLNILADPRGIHQCQGYGRSILVLKNVRKRTTFTNQDSGNQQNVVATIDNYNHVLYQYNNKELEAVYQVANTFQKNQDPSLKIISESYNLLTYKEAQIHGEIRFADHVQYLYYCEDEWKNRSKEEMNQLLDQFQQRNKDVVIIKME